MSTGSQTDEVGIADGRFQLFSVQRALVIFNVGVTCRTKAFQRLLMHPFNQQKFNFIFLQRYLCHFPDPVFFCHLMLCVDLHPSFNISKKIITAI
ncbi:Uncharacterised protein [Salmonella enterica subsp. enterica serovar Bovismorbificans]|uniref:Uncharacterized protein n=1 Tax=Salmonella enterica subsp. enterica serovar Bovismorbificans TaxID=58097 RepID=A0A655E367_SALET|nr:Uncharacterised protein [Salmonella enterica subsp. enterica serovar Bovismorbificans]CNU23751.1 Uncharacterised protein [Salmonella enterica subsp. enterica serovar Bovismorbificans]CNU28316.1 Uncharacterised protein [Salmonella enterica subsp. enterica serovar Bovismorbificans]CNU73884.1 Uncharacterised protein [Salmonella enterica subsp. enterica serovar Bovismorbificans]CNU86261.1 Uncharacterised protein [Salmonella enterica subsp. enterica serovar Bovismorbificans]